MSSLPVYLQAELSTLSNEARRKFPEIKEACEKVIMIMRITKDRTANEIAEDLAKTEETLKPIYLACNSKMPKLISIAIACLQKLILHKAVPEKSIGNILKVLSEILNHNIEVQLRVLQTVLPLLTNYDNIQGELLNSALLICFRLQESKVSVVNNTAAATLRQLLIIIFDKKIKFSDLDHLNYDKDILDKSIEHDIQTLVSCLSPDAKDAYFLFQDLCYMTNGEAPLLLKLNSLNRTFGLELIESVLTNQIKVFQVYPEFTALLREKLCPLIIRSFSEKGDFPQTTRIMRLVFLIIRLFNHVLVMECEIFISMLLKALESDNILWHRVLAAEVIKGICNDFRLLKSIYKGYDRDTSSDGSSNLFRDIINILNKLINENPMQFRNLMNSNSLSLELNQANSQSNSIDQNVFSVNNSAMKIQCIDLLDKADAPNIPSGYMLFIALNSIESIINGLCMDILPNFRRTDNNNNNNNANNNNNNINITTDSNESMEPYDKSLFVIETKNDNMLIKEMVKLSWTGMLAGLSFLAKLPMDKVLTLLVVDCLKNFTLITALFQLNDARDAFLSCLSQHSYPYSNTILLDKSSFNNSDNNNYLSNIYSPSMSNPSIPIITERHVMFLKSILYIASKLSDVLEQSWLTILETLQTIQHLLLISFKSGGHKANSYSTKEEHLFFGKDKLNEIEINLLQSDIKLFFENVKYLNEESYNCFITCLIKLAAESNGNKFIDLEYIKKEKELNEEKQLLSSSSSSISIKTNLRSEESLFSVEQLRSVCLSSMPRLINQEDHQLWDLILNNLINMANKDSTNFGIRTQICETISDLILTGMNCAASLRLDTNKRLQFQMVLPLAQLMGIEKYQLIKESTPIHAILQKCALEILDKLLHNSGHSFTYCWNIVFDILLFACPENFNSGILINNPYSIMEETDHSSINSSNRNIPSIKLVRIAFPCLQLICTDFLPPLPLDCLFNCIITVSRFGLQLEDLNTSLTSISMLWNVLDFIQKSLDNNRLELQLQDKKLDFLEFEIIDFNNNNNNNNNNIGIILSQLYLLTLNQLTKMGLDSRPEVRNGAIQTLFRTINNNGQNIPLIIWNTIIWKILYSFIDKVNLYYSKACSTTADKMPEFSDMMFHHSRNTAQKQWDETRVLIIHGLTNLYKEFLACLINSYQFLEGWKLMLIYLKEAILMDSYEVSLCSVKAFNKLFMKNENFNQLNKEITKEMWLSGWIIWKQLGIEICNKDEINVKITPLCTPIALQKEGEVITALSEPILLPKVQRIQQNVFVCYIEIYSLLLNQLQLNDFNKNDFNELFLIFYNIISYNFYDEFINDINNCSQLQIQFIKIIERLQKDGNLQLKLFLLQHLPKFGLLSINENQLIENNNNKGNNNKGNNYVKLSCLILEIIGNIFPDVSDQDKLYEDINILNNVYNIIEIVLKQKYQLMDEINTNNNNQLIRWKLSNKLYNQLNEEIFNFIIKNSINEDNEFQLLIKILNIANEFFKKGQFVQTQLSIQQLELDEKLEMETLILLFKNYIKLFQKKENKIKEDRLLLKFINLFFEISIMDLNSTSQGELPLPLSILIKEQLSFLALRCLISICMDEEKRNLLIHAKEEKQVNNINKTEDSDEEEEEFNFSLNFKLIFEMKIPNNLKKLAAPILLERCYIILNRFSTSIPTFGKRPLPRLQRDEILFLLRHLSELELPMNTFENFNNLKFISTNDNATNLQYFNSKTPHLFLFYSCLIDILNCKDAAIVDRVAICLKKIGSQLGLL